MASGSGRLSYARGSWAASDATWCAFMGEVQHADVRADVRDAMMRVLRYAHTHMYDASRWKGERARWAKPYRDKPLPAFRVSIAQLAQESGLSQRRVWTALRKARELGLLVRLSVAHGKGEGKGSVPDTYTFACYVRDAANDHGETATTATATTTTTPEQERRARAERARSKWL